MIKTIEIRKVIHTYLKTKHSRVYYQSPPETATMLYVVYDMPNSIDDGSMERFILDIDIWDNADDTTALETLADSIDKGLHRKTVSISGTITATFYRENRLALKDDDPRIRRRKIIYQIRTHE